MSRLQELQDVVVPAIVRRNRFDGGQFTGYEFDSFKKIEELKMSDIIFLTLNFKKDGFTFKEKIIIKFEPRQPEVRSFAHSEEQFFNEIYAYEIILPFIDRQNLCHIFPKYYASASNVVVVEDVSVSGFRMSDVSTGTFLDLDHARLAMQYLGRFHAISYAAKAEDPVGFFNIVKEIKEVHWLHDKEDTFYYSCKAGFARAVSNLSVARYTEKIQNFEKHLERKCEFFLEVAKADEPLAVICHGDFCRNNIMYRYDDEGKPVDIKLIDLATVRYASPVIDMSLFMFLNVSSEQRASHLDDLLRVYHDALSVFPHVPIPTLEDIKTEFQRKSLYGLLHSLYFLPISSASVTKDNVFDFVSFCKTSCAKSRGKIISEIGGKQATALLSQLVHECLEKNYL